MPPSSLPIGFLTGLSSQIAKGVSAGINAGVASGVNASSALVEGALSRVAQVSRTTFSGVGQDITQVIDSAISGIQSANDQVRQQMMSVAKILVTGAASRAMGFIGLGGGGGSRGGSGGGGGGGALGGIMGVFGSLFGGVRNLFGRIMGPLSSIAGVVFGFLGIVRNAVVGLFRFVAQGILAVGGFVLNLARGALAVIAPVVQGAIGLAGRMLVGSVQLLWNGATAVMGALGQAIMAGIRTVVNIGWNSLRTIFMGAFTAARQMGQSMLLAIRAGLSAVATALAPFLPVIIAVFGAIITVIGTVVAAAIAVAARMIANAITLAFRVGSFVFNSILAPLWGVLRNVLVGAFRVGQGAYNAVAPILAQVARTVAGWLRAGFAWLQSAFQTVGAWVGQAASAIGSFVSRLISFAPTFISTFTSILSRVWTFGAALVTLVGTLSLVAIGVSAIWQTTKEAMSLAKTANQMSATNGLSSGTNAGIMQRFSAFGIGAQTVQGAFGGNAGLQSMKAGVFGLPSVQDPNFLNAFADKYGEMMSQGFMGQMMATNMAKVLGLDNPEILALSKLTPQQRAGQQKFASKIDQSLGLNPEKMVRQATEVNLSINKIGYAFQQLKLKLFSIAGPMVERVTALVAGAIGSNAGRISGFLERAVKWLFVDAPPIIMGAISTIATGINDAVITLIDVGNFLVANIPVWLGNATNFIANVLLNIAVIVQEVGTFIASALQYISDLAANWSQSLLEVGPQLVNGIAEMFVNIGATIEEWTTNIGNYIIDFAINSENGLRTTILGMLGAVDTLINGLNTLRGFFGGLSTAIVEGLKQSVATAFPALAGPITALFGPIIGPAAGYLKGSREATSDATTSNLRGEADKLFEKNQFAIIRAGGAFKRGGKNFNANMNEAAQYVTTNGTNLINSASANLNSFSGSAGRGAANVAGWTADSTKALTDLSKTIRPMGEEAGNAIVKPIQAATDFLTNTAQPLTGKLAAAAQSGVQAVGTPEQRNQEYLRIIADEAKQQTSLLQEGMKNGNLGGAMNEAFKGALSEMLVQTAAKTVRGIL